MPIASRWLVAAALALSASACVTINIYFPAAAAEKAADRIIDEVWQLREGAGEAPAPETTQGEAK
ncbi:MAG: hypothetical protein KAX54_04425 [Thauera sp.]|jgi:hypothetical protein|nr:hypothetical protein [Thauera sp.]MBP7467127.1 hypothetical protein [Thauera sp.]MBP8216870.1 hypothetical protein [Thauera sp.]MBP8922494.1 hypothetical protein [Thauera sp.]